MRFVVLALALAVSSCANPVFLRVKFARLADSHSEMLACSREDDVLKCMDFERMLMVLEAEGEITITGQEESEPVAPAPLMEHEL